MLFSNCEITTDWYVIKLVYVMAEENYRLYKGNYLSRRMFTECYFPFSFFFLTVSERTVVTKDIPVIHLGYYLKN